MLNRLPAIAMLSGLAALYFGERALSGGARWTLVGLGGLLVAAALGTAFLRVARAEGERKRAFLAVAVEYCVAALAVLLYFAQTSELALVPVGKAQTLIMVLWPAILLLGLTPAIAMEAALASMARAPAIELWRVRRGGRAARIAALAVVAFAGANYTASQWSRKIDLSYFKTSKAGSATLAIVEGLTQPVELLLFFPPGNEVLEHARAYADTLDAKSEQVSVRVVDQALEVELARELKVRNNGYLVLRSGERSEQLRLELDLEDARSALRNLDAEVQERLLKVVRPPRIAYFTAGHLERDWIPPGDDKRLGISDLKALVEGQGFQVRRLGLTEGLGSAVPDDATLVVVAGPAQAFLPNEREALKAYIARGGRLMVFIDPDQGVLEPELLAALGLEVSKGLVAHERYLVRLEGRGESPYNMATTQSASHPSVHTLQLGANRLYVALLGAGALNRLDQVPQGAEVTFSLRAMPQSWVDTNGNGKFDEGSEKRDTVSLAAAVEIKPGAEKATPPARAIVVSDADLVGNVVVRNTGNQYFVIDGLRWLTGEEKMVGKQTETEKDVPIVHRTDEDTVWFYGTSFIIPAAVLFGGLAFTRRTRRARKES